LTLLILTQYFPPETGAPQNRLYELAVRLTREGVKVHVLTAMPNYPSMKIFPAYRGKKYLREEMDGIVVHRTSIFVSQDRGITARLRNYFSFVYSSARASSKLDRQFDFLLCESPPLFLGYSAMYLARKKKAKLIFNVSDLWPESAEKLGVVTNKFMLNMAYALEEKLYKRSVFVTGQTQGICSDIARRFPQVETYWLPNGVDLTAYDPTLFPRGLWRQKNGFNDDDKLFLYAGIIGIAQGLEVIIEAARLLSERGHVKFILMGAGPEKSKLMELVKKYGLPNVVMFDPVPRQEMAQVLRDVDAAVVPLRKLPLFLGAIPSKIFEALAMELPLFLGVDGEARELFVNKGNCAFYFEPENADQLKAAVEEFIRDEAAAAEKGRNGRAYVMKYFNRDVIASSFYQKLRNT
jgi:glycosyltransferase involved in cell wall biosynthesis